MRLTVWGKQSTVDLARVDQAFVDNYLRVFLLVKARACLGSAHVHLALDARASEYDLFIALLRPAKTRV